MMILNLNNKIIYVFNKRWIFEYFEFKISKYLNIHLNRKYSKK